MALQSLRIPSDRRSETTVPPMVYILASFRSRLEQSLMLEDLPAVMWTIRSTPYAVVKK